MLVVGEAGRFETHEARRRKLQITNVIYDIAGKKRRKKKEIEERYVDKCVSSGRRRRTSNWGT
jgi:hypothetical protein